MNIILRSQNNFDYMIQRPKDGIIILGGGRWKAPIELSIPQTDDSIKIPEFTKHLSEAMPNYVQDWNDPVQSGAGKCKVDGNGERKQALNEGLLVDWTGVMGYTPEAVPYVGPLVGKKNAYINAGHSGHGAFLCYLRLFVTCSPRGIAFAIFFP